MRVNRMRPNEARIFLGCRLVPPLTVAKAINDSGVIVGEGITTGNETHAFLLTPTQVIIR